MTHRFIVLCFLCSLCLPAAGNVVRIVAVHDASTIVVEQGRSSVHVRLAGIEIIDPVAARTLLEWTLTGRWVMLERKEGGGAFVYRSPDALFINRELVAQGFARATAREVMPENRVIVTYLGRLDPPVRKGPAVKPAPARENGTGASRRSSTRPSPRRRRR